MQTTIKAICIKKLWKFSQVNIASFPTDNFVQYIHKNKELHIAETAVSLRPCKPKKMTY